MRKGGIYLRAALFRHSCGDKRIRQDIKWVNYNQARLYIMNSRIQNWGMRLSRGEIEK
jgi:hypothetical protein